MDPLYNIHFSVSYEQKVSLHKTGSKWKVSQQNKPNSPGDEMAVVPTWRYSLTFFQLSNIIPDQGLGWALSILHGSNSAIPC